MLSTTYLKMFTLSHYVKFFAGAAAAIALIGAGAGIAASEDSKRKATHSKEDLEEKEKSRKQEAFDLTQRENTDRQRRISLYGKPSTFTSFKESPNKKNKTLG